MNEKDIKSKAIASVFWKFMERIGAQLVSLVVSVILARMLEPDDYSVVSIVTIFFAFANVLISGGFNSALIQKKDSDDEDYSTVLHISVLMSFAIYIILYLVAPYIAHIYQQDILVSIIRIMGISLPITAIKSIWCARVSSTLHFKTFFISTFIATIISAVVGIYMAYSGFGPWALVAQQISNTVISTIILVLNTRIHIVWKISLSKFKTLFAYGWKVFVSSIIGRIYVEIIPIVIGLKYSNADLAYYTKGRSFPDLITSSSTSTFSAVLFPTLAKFQDSKEKLLYGTRLFIRITSFFAMPMMLGFFAISDNFVSVVLTEKWMPIVPYIKIFCISSMFEMVHVGNCETVKAMGRSDIFLIMEIIKKSGYFICIALFLVFTDSPQFLAIAFIACTVIALIVNAVPNVKLIDYKISHQIKDIMPNLITSIIMCIAVSLIGMLNISPFILLIIQVITGAIIYLVLNMIIRNSSLIYAFDFVRRSIFKKGNKKQDD